jgi:hypothetical protein
MSLLAITMTAVSLVGNLRRRAVSEGAEAQ